MYESQVIPKGIKTNYFAPTKIHIHYKTIKIYNKEKSSKVINNQHNLQTQSPKSIIKNNHNNSQKTIIIDNKK